MGRPPKDPEDQSSEFIGIRMTTAERELCEQAAEQAELKLSAWIRDRATKAAKREARLG